MVHSDMWLLLYNIYFLTNQAYAAETPLKEHEIQVCRVDQYWRSPYGCHRLAATANSVAGSIDLT